MKIAFLEKPFWARMLERSMCLFGRLNVCFLMKKERTNRKIAKPGLIWDI